MLIAETMLLAGLVYAAAAAQPETSPERQFYVGQSYNSLQILYGLVPTAGKTIVFYLNRTSTDQVAGFPTGTRHSLGRKIMEKEVRRPLEEVLASLGSRPKR